MYERSVMIDEQFVKITCDSPVLWSYITDNFRPVNDVDPRKKADIELDIAGDYGAPFSGFDVQVANLGHVVLFKRSDYLIAVAPDFCKAVIKAYDRMALKHALLNFYSSYLIHYESGLLIHSSCVIDHGFAHMFAGQSGVGKSTAARLSHPRKLLSDEATLIKISPETGTIRAYNSPFRSDIGAIDGGIPCELKSIQLLHQHTENKRTRVTKEASPVQLLLPRTFYWPHTDKELSIIHKLLNKIVEQVPVYDLYFQKNNTFWKLIS